VIYGVFLLRYYQSEEIVSPDGTLKLEFLDLSEDGAGCHMSIDYVGSPDRNVFSVHWVEETTNILHFNDTDPKWFAQLEDWYDRIHAVTGVCLPSSRPADTTSSPTDDNRPEFGQLSFDF
jgi:hypothetical protein